MDKYLVTFEDTFSFAIEKREAMLTDEQYKKAVAAKEQKQIVINRFDKKQGIHYTMIVKDIQKA